MDEFEKGFLKRRLVDTESVESPGSFKNRNKVYIDVSRKKMSKPRRKLETSQSSEGEHCELRPSYFQNNTDQSTTEQEINPVFQNDKSPESPKQEPRKTKSTKSVEQVRRRSNRRRGNRKRPSKEGPRLAFWRKQKTCKSRRRRKRRRRTKTI